MGRALYQDHEMCVRVGGYAPGERHPPHRDDFSRITLTLRGSFAEDGERGSEVVRPGDVLFKSRDAVHEDRFGDDGANLVSLVFFGRGPDGLLGGGFDGVWRVRRDPAALRGGTGLLDAAVAGHGAGVRAAASELLGGLDGAEQSRRTAPAWLMALKDELENTGFADVDVSARARSAGAHPAHVSRLFRRCFGISITEHAQAHGVRRAVASLGDGAALSAAAAGAGFYDQSHMSRVFRRVTGRTPGAYRKLAAAAGG